MKAIRLLIGAGALVALVTVSTPAFAANAIEDPSFEAGAPNPFWSESSSNNLAQICDSSCGANGNRTGDWFVWMGGFGAGIEQSTVTQTVTVPEGDDLALEFYLSLDQCSGNPADRVRVEFGADLLFERNATSAECLAGYMGHSVDVTAYAGQTVDLNLRAATQGGGITSFFFDDFELDGAAEIFADGFEDGTTNAWGTVKGDVTVVAPGLSGSDFKLEVPVDGSATKHFVQSTDAAGLTAVEIEFFVAANNVDLGDKAVEVLRVFDQTPDDLIRVTVRQKSATSYKVKLFHRGDSGVLASVGQMTLDASAGSKVRVEWTASTADGADDGTLKMYRNDNLKLEVNGLDDDMKEAGTIRVGLPAGSSAILGVGGTLFVDEVAISDF